MFLFWLWNTTLQWTFGGAPNMRTHTRPHHHQLIAVIWRWRNTASPSMFFKAAQRGHLICSKTFQFREQIDQIIYEMKGPLSRRIAWGCHAYRKCGTHYESPHGTGCPLDCPDSTTLLPNVVPIMANIGQYWEILFCYLGGCF